MQLLPGSQEQGFRRLVLGHIKGYVVMVDVVQEALQEVGLKYGQQEQKGLQQEKENEQEQQHRNQQPHQEQQQKQQNQQPQQQEEQHEQQQQEEQQEKQQQQRQQPQQQEQQQNQQGQQQQQQQGCALNASDPVSYAAAADVSAWEAHEGQPVHAVFASR